MMQGREDVDFLYELSPLPYAARMDLQEWTQSMVNNTPIYPPPRPDTVPHCHTLFTDASSHGWGAVLYLDHGQVVIAGEKWPDDFDYEVNKAEVRAVSKAFQKFDQYFRGGTCVKLFVDNTSCVSAINRKITSSDGIAEELRKILDFLNRKDMAVDCSYVHTLKNPADALSRGL